MSNCLKGTENDIISKRFKERSELEKVFSRVLNEEVDDDIDDSKLLKDQLKGEG